MDDHEAVSQASLSLASIRSLKGAIHLSVVFESLSP